MIALCFFTGLCDGNASSHPVIHECDKIRISIELSGNSTALTQNFNFNDLKNQRDKIKDKIINEANEEQIFIQQNNSALLIKGVKCELAAMAVGINIQDSGIICVAISQIIATLIDLQESYELDPIEENTFLYYVYTIEENSSNVTPWLTNDSSENVYYYLSDIFKKSPTGAILVIPLDITSTFDIEQVSIASAIEKCQAKIRERNNAR